MTKYFVSYRFISPGMVTVDHILDGKVHPDPDLWIKAGKVYTVSIFIEQTGVTLRWQFSTEPKVTYPIYGGYLLCMK